MSGPPHLIVENGPEKGRTVIVGADGSRLGRSSKNDIALPDPALSRYHSRFFIKPGEGLWVADLGSANETMVNDQVVQETRLKVGDRILVGDTTLRVTHDAGQAGGAVDLGLGPGPDAPRKGILSTHNLIVIACVVIALAAMVWAPKLLNRAPVASADPADVAAVEQPQTFEVDYEKVLADAHNIFRYHLRIDAEGIISVQIDDIENDRHVRKESKADPDYLQDLARDLEESGFFTLYESYQGIQPDIYNLWDLTITLGHRTHRSTVLNRIEPEIFRIVRETLEETGKNELGLWAIQFSAETLTQMAQDAHLLGKKLFDAREVKFGNMAEALKSFTEAEWYLETVEPKPEFYPDTVSLIRDCKEHLDASYKDQNFRAERAIRLRDWSQAAQELRILCQIIPDRSDPRNQEARKKLLDVENRVEGM